MQVRSRQETARESVIARTGGPGAAAHNASAVTRILAFTDHSVSALISSPDSGVFDVIDAGFLLR